MYLKKEIALCKGWVHVSEDTSLYGKGSFNLNGKAGYDKEGEVQEVQRLMGMDTAKKKTTASSTSSASGNEEALA
ncbi:hypothetical protein Tco_0919612, partial [Tanacetum coccineum]